MKEERKKKREARRKGAKAEDTPRDGGDMGKTPRGDIDEDGEVQDASPQDKPGSASKTGKSSPE